MSRNLSDTVAIAAKPVLETANPDYSGFRNSTPGRGMTPMRDTGVGNERPTAALTRRLQDGKI